MLIRGEWDTIFSFEDAESFFLQLKNAVSKRYVVIDQSTHVLHLEKNRFALYDEVESLRDINSPTLESIIKLLPIDTPYPWVGVGSFIFKKEVITMTAGLRCVRRFYRLWL